jgi:hypothetical protein
MPRVLLLVLAFLVATTPCHAAKPGIRDGSTKEKAIPLTQRYPAKAVEEEMAWMMKLYHYTPLLATRDGLVKAMGQLKAGKAKEVHLPHDWGHASLDYNGHLISEWWFLSPRGKRDIYFDTGTRINTPGEVVRQESARAAYLLRTLPTLKLQ